METRLKPAVCMLGVAWYTRPGRAALPLACVKPNPFVKVCFFALSLVKTPTIDNCYVTQAAAGLPHFVFVRFLVPATS